MIAGIALFTWPLVSVFFFRRLSLPMSVCVTIVGGYLLLPERIEYDLPIVPALNKHSIPVLTAFFMTIFTLNTPNHGEHVLEGWVPRNAVAILLIMLLVIGTFGMVSTNQDPLFYGPTVLPGMRIYDGFSFNLTVFVSLLPLLLARRVFATPEAQKVLLGVLVVSALIYSIPLLWEVRMSPQLHRQVYGFFQHSFGQQIRNDGFRAMVFLSHGLTLSVFISTAVLSAVGMMRIGPPSHRMKWAIVAAWLFVMLILNKSLGALAITIVLVPVVLIFKARMQLLVAAGIGLAVLIFPMLRAADVIPTERAAAFAATINESRAQSLNYRFENEDILLEKALERPVFGWGGYGRNRVFNENGVDVSVTDGEWVIHFGIGGWLRYIGFFGLLCWPIIALFFGRRDRVDLVCSILALVLCAKLIDLIPNSGVFPYTWMIAGSLLGRLEISSAERREDRKEPDQIVKGPLKYSRSLNVPETDARPFEEKTAEKGIRYTRARGIRQRHVK